MKILEIKRINCRIITLKFNLIIQHKNAQIHSCTKNTQFEQVSKKPLYHFGQVNFNMSIVIGVVFFIGPFDK